MIGILILTHGGMADELLAAARRITGDLEGFEALSLDWDASLEDATEKVRIAVQDADQGDGVLILTDIFGGTPSNVAMKQRLEGRVEVVSGVNLPMVVRLGCLLSSQSDPMPLDEMTLWIEGKGQSSICSSLSNDSKPMRKAGC